MNKFNGMALKEIRGIAFELIKRSSDKERRFSIEDSGDYFTIQLTIRVIPEELRTTLNRINKKSSQHLEI